MATDHHRGQAWTNRHATGLLTNEEDSILAPFFGSNVPGPKKARTNDHPCALYSNQVHQCLDKNSNRFEFCTPVFAKFEMCLREAE